MKHHTAPILLILGLTSIFAIVSLLGMMDHIEGVQSQLTGASVAYHRVGYVAVSDQATMKASMESIRRYPVSITAGQFRGYYYLKIEGNPNTVKAAMYHAAIHADQHHALVYSGLQVEPYQRE